MRDALLVVDVFNDFDHDDGDALRTSFEQRLPAMTSAIRDARAAGTPVVYVNDRNGRWDSDAPGLVQEVLDHSRAGRLAGPLVPRGDDFFVIKPRYSAFDHTPLALLLEELGVERILLMGAATEGCVVQSGIDARELGLKVTILAAACATTDRALAELALRYAAEVGGMRIDRA